MTIFSRLVSSYLVLFVLLSLVSAFAIHQLGQFEGLISSVILTDFHVLDLHKKLTDTVLSESQYEKKFLIIQERELYKGFLQAAADFDRYIEEAAAYADNETLQGQFAGLKSAHQQYKDILAEEVGLILARKKYTHAEYRTRKEDLVNGILNDLKKLRAGRQDDILNGILGLGEAGKQARKLVITITVVFVFLGIFLSVLITRGITRPLKTMKVITAEIARGNFESRLHLDSPPEIADLADAINVMSEKLHEVDKLKGNFFSLMSHELRTPLTSIREGTYLLLEGTAGETTERQKRLLSIIVEESNRLINLVSSLLDLSKMEAGMLSFEFVDAQLPPLIEKTVTELLPLAAARSIWMEKEIGDLPTVRLDQERILQVLRNILGNAVKFSPEGAIISIGARRIPEGVQVSVSDQGPGIPEKFQQTIFDKFRQAEMTGNSKVQGTGLGLAVVKHIVTAHGGRVWVESEEGNGSTFSFVLPV